MTQLDELLAGQVQYREFQIRAVNTETREVEGIAVPWGELASLPGFTESMERGAVQDSDDAQLWWRHTDPIGKLLLSRDDEDGWFVRAKVSETALGNDALTLARDGVVKSFSVGFVPDEYVTEQRDDGSVHVRHTKIKVREFSLVPIPAYKGAGVTAVREGAPFTPRKETTMPEGDTITLTPQQWAEHRAEVEALTAWRSTVHLVEDHTPTIDTRSAGEWLKLLARGDAETIKAYDELWTRAYDGTQGSLQDLGNTLKPAWVGDLTRIIDAAAPLKGFFATGTLPPEGMTVEYMQLKSNTVQYEEQVEEYDDLAYGKVQLELKYAEVKTYGGWSELSRQVIERSQAPVLDTTLRAQSVAAGQRMNRALRAIVKATLTAQAANAITLPDAEDGTYKDFISAIVDAAVKFDAIGYGLDGMIANPTLFKYLANLEASDGRPVLLVTGNGSNNVGTINPKALEANIANVVVTMDAGLTAANAAPYGAFASREAVRSYVGPVVRLQDENIINLSKQYSAYNYAAFAAEVPGALVPLAFAAPAV